MYIHTYKKVIDEKGSVRLVYNLDRCSLGADGWLRLLAIAACTLIINPKPIKQKKRPHTLNRVRPRLV